MIAAPGAPSPILLYQRNQYFIPRTAASPCLRLQETQKALRNRHFRAGLQPILAGGHDRLAFVETALDHGDPAEYEHLRALLAPLAMPVFVIPGNHDAREPLRAGVRRRRLSAG